MSFTILKATNGFYNIFQTFDVVRGHLLIWAPPVKNLVPRSQHWIAHSKKLNWFYPLFYCFKISETCCFTTLCALMIPYPVFEIAIYSYVTLKYISKSMGVHSLIDVLKNSKFVVYFRISDILSSILLSKDAC